MSSPEKTAVMVYPEWITSVEKRIEKCERGQAITQYMLHQLQTSSQEHVDLLTNNLIPMQEIMTQGLARLEAVIEEWDEDHSLMETVMRFTKWLDDNAKFSNEERDEINERRNPDGDGSSES